MARITGALSEIRADQESTMSKRRRGATEGTIFQRKDKRWVARLTLRWEAGRQIRWESYSATESEAQEKLLKARFDHSRGLPVAIEKKSVREFFDRWLEQSVKPTVRLTSWQQYYQHVRLYLGPSLGSYELAKLSAPHVQGFINQMLKSGLSPRTVRLSLDILRHALDQAMKWDLVFRNVAKLVDAPRMERREMIALDQAQAGCFLDAATGERLEALYSVALSMGLREGEALALRWSDIDFDRRQLSIRQTLQRMGGKRFGHPGSSKLVFQEPKTDRSRRTLHLPETIVLALRRHRTAQLQERLLAGSAWQEHGLVFPNTIGNPLEPRDAVADFKRILAKAGLSASIRFHDLRHSAASLLLAQGVQLRAIMELLGHSSIALTANTYSHILPSVMQDLAEKMDAVLGGSR
jgi:integrase